MTSFKRYRIPYISIQSICSISALIKYSLAACVIAHSSIARGDTTNYRTYAGKAGTCTENARACTEDPRLFTRNARTCAENPRSITRNARTYAESPKSYTRNARSYTRNSRTYTKKSFLYTNSYLAYRMPPVSYGRIYLSSLAHPNAITQSNLIRRKKDILFRTSRPPP